MQRDKQHQTIDIQTVNAIALSVRSLAMDAVQAANSGHPGLPMGLAELGALIYGEILDYSVNEPHWPDRDRFVLSAGHGSMLLYSLLHLAGYNLPLEQIKRFRQIGSITPGHPERGLTEGIETTTGPLGQGISNAVGMAIAEQFLAARFNTSEHTIVDHYTYVIASDGDMMEGVASEASSLAGHLRLGKLIVFYDDNKISIEGRTELAFSEDVEARFRAYGWHTLSGSAYDVHTILDMVARAQREVSRPTLIRLTSIIGKGSPHKADTAAVHGAALGEAEVLETRRKLGLGDDEEFFIHPVAAKWFARRRAKQKERSARWNTMFTTWSRANPRLRSLWDDFHAAPDVEKIAPPTYNVGDQLATREASGAMLQAVTTALPNIIGGSADLAPSNNTALPAHGDFSADDRSGRTLHFGVREHGMGAICNGIAAHGGLQPFCATFLVFTDYMRPSIRMAALMGLPVIYIMTHDSIYLGEDGPTHQPIEHYAALRAIPNTQVLRPGDAEESVEAWKMALETSSGPTLLLLTRQKLEVYAKPADWRTQIRNGAYTVHEAAGAPRTPPEIVLVATGSEVNLALKACQQSKRRVRVVSVISRERFQRQPLELHHQLLPPQARVIVVEAGIAQGWEHFVAHPNDLMVLSDFGASGPASQIAKHFSFDVERLLQIIERRESQQSDQPVTTSSDKPANSKPNGKATSGSSGKASGKTNSKPAAHSASTPKN